MQIGTLEAVQVGKPQRQIVGDAFPNAGTGWRSSFVRVPSTEPRWLYLSHLDGNKQADTKHHGSPDQAVLLYALAHYALWQAELENPTVGPGGFGENFTVAGLSEADTCIGDTFALGEAELQVSGPRYPCYKIERRWNTPGLTKRVAATGRTGWYCRVLKEGMIEPGLSLQLIKRPHPYWSIALLNDLIHGRRPVDAQSLGLSECPELTPLWREVIAHNYEKQVKAG